ADQLVLALAAVDDVVAAPALDRIVALAAVQHVVEVRSPDRVFLFEEFIEDLVEFVLRNLLPELGPVVFEAADVPYRVAVAGLGDDAMNRAGFFSVLVLDTGIHRDFDAVALEIENALLFPSVDLLIQNLQLFEIRIVDG